MPTNFILNVTSVSSNDGPGATHDLGNDGNTGSTWDSGSTNGPPQWWYGDLGVGITKKLAKVRINPYWDSNGSMFRSGIIQGSNDASTWTDLITITDMPNAAGWNEYTCTPSTAYRYFRVYITANWRTVGLYCGFNEVEMYEATPSGARLIHFM